MYQNMATYSTGIKEFTQDWVILILRETSLARPGPITSYLLQPEPSSEINGQYQNLNKRFSLGRIQNALSEGQ
jgi:hypothetical protein